MFKSKKFGLLSILLVLILVLAACGQSDEVAEEIDTLIEADDVVAEVAEPLGETGPGTYLARAESGEFNNKSVTIMGVWPEEEAVLFREAFQPFVDRTGINVTYEGSGDFETLIIVRTEAGDPPDIAIFPQPGLMADFVRGGSIPDHSDVWDLDKLAADFSSTWTNLATVDGVLSGLPYKVATKSLVFYDVNKWADLGYEPPTTWDEMIALMDEMVANGQTPWCIPLESSGATGWVATDWVEEIVLRTAGAEVYDDWVTHEIPFSDPRIKNAIETMGDIWLNPDYVLGGTTGILTTWIGEVSALFDPPEIGCMMHRQAGWITAFFPDTLDPEVDSAFFYFPAIDPAHGNPVLGAGDLASAFNLDPEVRAFMEYLSTAEGVESWVKAGGFITPNSNVPFEWYESALTRLQAEILQNATTLRFDGSDLMPGAVGAGSFWTGMVDYVGGDDLDTVLEAIDNSWPTE
jgi:alpha-glucoside transport system substrate-binding protein